jgi:hypothetical protein
MPFGSPFVWDLEFSQTKPALSFAYRYYVAKAIAIRAEGTYGILAGNDNLTTDPFRQNRKPELPLFDHRSTGLLGGDALIRSSPATSMTSAV